MNNTYDYKKKLLTNFNEDNIILDCLSNIMNIHIERFKIIERKLINHKKITILEEQYILIFNKENVEIFDNKSLEDYQRNNVINKYIIFQDIIKDMNLRNDEEKNLECLKKNLIIVINNKDILNKEYCDEIRNTIDNIINKEENQIQKWKNGSNVNCLYFYSFWNEFKNNEEIQKLDNNIYKIISKIVQRLEKNYQIQCKGDSGYCFRKIFGPTRLHIDNIFNGFSLSEHKLRYSNDYLFSEHKLRNMSIIICLNDDYEGGEFYFPRQNYKIKLKQGDILCFPPYYTHPHMVNSLTNKTYRYTINTWLYQ